MHVGFKQRVPAISLTHFKRDKQSTYSGYSIKVTVFFNQSRTLAKWLLQHSNVAPRFTRKNISPVKVDNQKLVSPGNCRNITSFQSFIATECLAII